MAAAIFPEEQAKAQAELDAVIGRDRGMGIVHPPIRISTQALSVPRIEDQTALARVTAFALECFRWRPTSWGSK